MVRDGQVVEWNDYYAYGAVRDKWSLADGRWKYLGKELDNETATQHLDAREYDGLVGRLWQVDPMWRLYPHQSPYLYANANPFRFSDRSGMASDSVTVAPEIVVTADRDPARRATAMPISAPSPIFLGIVGSALVIDWATLQIAITITSALTGSPREIYADQPLLSQRLLGDRMMNPNDIDEPVFEIPLPTITTYNPPPETLEAFPDAKKVPNKNRRARWKDSDGNIYEWDYQHGKVEKFNKTGKKHLGEYDPKTGKQTKPPDKTRKTDN